MKYQLAHWKGSVNTAEQVREEIARRYGEEDENAKEGEQTAKRTYPKTVYLFYIKQVEKKQ